jgi:hypothetical protein
MLQLWEDRIHHQLYLWVSGFVSIAEGIVMVVSLGFVVPTWTFQLCVWHMKYSLKRSMKQSIDSDNCSDSDD